MIKEYLSEYNKISAAAPERAGFKKAVYFKEIEKSLARSELFRFLFNLELVFYEKYHKRLHDNTNMRRATTVGQHVSIVTNNSITDEEVLASALYCIIENDYKGLSILFRKVTPETRQFLKIVLFGRTIRLIGIDRGYEMLQTVDTLDTLIKKLPLPSVSGLLKALAIKGNIRFQEMRQNRLEDAIYPLYVLDIPRGLGKTPRLRYLIKKNGEVLTNVYGGNRRRILKKAIKFEEGGLLFFQTKHKHKSRLVPIYFDYSVENVNNLYSGAGKAELKEEGFKTKHLIKPTYFILQNRAPVFIKDKEQLEEYFSKAKSFNRFIGVTTEGVVFFNTRYSTKSCDIVDFILDDRYNPKGLVVDIEGNTVGLRFNVPKDLLENGIDFRKAYVKLGYLGNRVISRQLVGIVPKWSEQFYSCNICGRTKYKHKKAGVCAKCFSSLSFLVKGVVKDSVRFSGKFKGSSTFRYLDCYIEVSSRDNFLLIERVSEDSLPYQRILPFYEDIEEALNELHLDRQKGLEALGLET